MTEYINLKTVIKDTLENWEKYNPIFSKGHVAYVIETNKIKIYDGEHSFNDLPYLNMDGEGGNVDLSTVNAEINIIKKDLTHLRNEFDAVDLGEIGHKAEDDMVVHKKGVSGVEEINGPKTFMNTVILQGNTMEIGDVTNTAATTKFVTDSINDLKNNLPTDGNVDSAITTHNLSNQSHNDIRNLVKENKDAIAKKADAEVVDKLNTNLTLAEEDIDALQSDIAVFVTTAKDAALKSQENTFTKGNTFSGGVVVNGNQLYLTNGATIKDGTNDKNILNLLTINNNTQQLYLGNDEVWIKAPDSMLLESSSIKTKRTKSDGSWEEYTNIDSGNISNYTVQLSANEKYGIEADYKIKYGIIDCPRGLIDYSPNTKKITINSGIVFKMPQTVGFTTLSSANNTYTVEETGRIVLFAVKGGVGFLEAGVVYYQEEEPVDGDVGYVAWWKPSKGQWQFKSNDTGNVFREFAATPFANINASETGIITINYIGYRLVDDDCFAHLSDIESVNDTIETLTTTVNGLADNEIFTTNKPIVADIASDADLATVISSLNSLIGNLKTRGIVQ